MLTVSLYYVWYFIIMLNEITCDTLSVINKTWYSCHVFAFKVFKKRWIASWLQPLAYAKAGKSHSKHCKNTPLHQNKTKQNKKFTTYIASYTTVGQTNFHKWSRGDFQEGQYLTATCEGWAERSQWRTDIKRISKISYPFMSL